MVLMLSALTLCPLLALLSSHCFLQITELNEGPVFMLLNPFIHHSRKDLPVDVYETGGWE